jgi:hypothetical protein
MVPYYFQPTTKTTLAAVNKLLGSDFDIEKVKTLFTLPQAEYEAGLRNYIVTRAEKHALMAAIKELGVNDYRKIVFATSYTGINI